MYLSRTDLKQIQVIFAPKKKESKSRNRLDIVRSNQPLWKTSQSALESVGIQLQDSMGPAPTPCPSQEYQTKMKGFTDF